VTAAVTRGCVAWIVIFGLDKWTRDSGSLPATYTAHPTQLAPTSRPVAQLTRGYSVSWYPLATPTRRGPVHAKGSDAETRRVWVRVRVRG
jgi:hypothetical protein